MKDLNLHRLSRSANVARFASCDPTGQLRIAALGQDVQQVTSFKAAAEILLAQCGSLNVRTFLPEGLRSGPFRYGLAQLDAVLSEVRSLGDQGFYCLINETIDVNDGGVSGVLDGAVIEFGPDDTPRGVEGDQFASLPADVGLGLLSSVYGVDLDRNCFPSGRVEFSIHPSPVGTRHQRLLLWEAGDAELSEADQPSRRWPNSFSRMLGDKLYGLILADQAGGLVPATTALNRRIRPFSFGSATSARDGSTWLRTAPAVQTPGRFTTVSEWTDPFRLMAVEDPDGTLIPAILAQEGVPAVFSGATRWNGAVVVEGVNGVGDDFMLGARGPEVLPSRIVDDVSDCVAHLSEWFGHEITLEWAHDGERVWVLQVHPVEPATEAIGTEDFDGWLEFDPGSGLEHLEQLVSQARKSGVGIHVTSKVGTTSHIGEVLRRSSVAFRIA